MLFYYVQLSRCPVPTWTRPQGGRVRYTHASSGGVMTARGLKLSSLIFLEKLAELQLIIIS